MLGSIAAAGAWIRNFKEHYVELQSLREKKVRQDLMEIEVRLESLGKQIPKEKEFEAIESSMKERAEEHKQLNERIHRANEQLKKLKDPMNEQEKEKEKENPMEK
ncbi:PREDICTED: PRUPE_1G112200 [Prunus dulcis]|uniref:PREDICTED: PRUPE_1G112200 n=1 Tax=Prunus dulcis TaxID=3755 RepID=A0A5E4ES36_PRUDU|nr:hypothetical protein L3X38_014613 [Prunus dulcis]VVA18567.1 PREDICTED: PRUPE_1G112200 [Prunus dulcis]